MSVLQWTQPRRAATLNKGKELVVKEAKELTEKAKSGLESVTGEAIVEGKVDTVDMGTKKVTIKGPKGNHGCHGE